MLVDTALSEVDESVKKLQQDTARLGNRYDNLVWRHHQLKIGFVNLIRLFDGIIEGLEKEELSVQKRYQLNEIKTILADVKASSVGSAT